MLYINGQEEMDILNVSYIENIDKITIQNVDIIPEGKFAGLNKLQSITIKNVKKIDAGAFMNCKNLKEVYFDENLVTVEDFVFNNTKVAFLKDLYPNIIFGVYNNELNTIASLNDTPWYIINELAKKNIAQNYFNIGDTKKIKIGDYTYDFIILDFNHDELANNSHKKANITFGSKQLYEKLHCMDRSGSNCYGWTASDMRKYLMETCYHKFPEDIKKNMKNITKKTACNGKIIESNDKLFILSEIELCDMYRYSYTVESEGYLYEYYKNKNNRYKSKIDTKYNSLYWLRSPRNSFEKNFVHSWVSNACGSQLATTNLGVDLNFCI